EPVGGERGELGERLPLDARSEPAAVDREGVLVLLLLEKDEAEAAGGARKVRLHEVGHDRAGDEGGARGDAELARAAEEIVVAPAKEPAHLLFGVVPDARPHVARRRLRHLDADVDRVIVRRLLERDRAEEAEAEEIRGRAVEQAFAEPLARAEGDLAPDHGRLDPGSPGDRDGAEA